MKTYFTQDLANTIATDYQWLVGHKFISPYAGCPIDFVQPIQINSDNYQVKVIVDAFSKNSIPEIFGFRNPECELLEYLEKKGISFNFEKYLLR